jgi:hypothetical protein
VNTKVQARDDDIYWPAIQTLSTPTKARFFSFWLGAYGIWGIALGFSVFYTGFIGLIPQKNKGYWSHFNKLCAHSQVSWPRPTPVLIQIILKTQQPF